MIVTNDVHYIKAEDYRAHDVLLCIQTGKTVDEENRMKHPSDQFYLKSAEKMYSMFSHVLKFWKTPYVLWKSVILIMNFIILNYLSFFACRGRAYDYL